MSLGCTESRAPSFPGEIAKCLGKEEGTAAVCEVEAPASPGSAGNSMPPREAGQAPPLPFPVLLSQPPKPLLCRGTPSCLLILLLPVSIPAPQPPSTTWDSQKA